MPSSRIARRSAAAALGLALGWAALGPVPAARAAEPPPWQVVQVADFGEYDSMSSVGASGARNAWTFVSGAGAPGRLHAQHWDGRAWRAVPAPAEVSGVVRGVSATSAANAWAVGDADNASLGSFALRWNGRKWVVAHTFPTGVVSDVTAVRPGQAWVFSDGRRDAGVGTWHFDGRNWRELPLPFNLERGSALSSDDVWAIGNTAEDVFKLVAHYDGTSWTPVPTGDALPDDIIGGEGEPSQHVFLRDVVAVSAQEVWVVGYLWRDDGAGASEVLPVAARWDGSRWQKVDVPGRWSPHAAAPDGRGGLWISGGGEAPPEGGREAPVLMHRSPGGTWSNATIQVGDRTGYVDGLALIPGTTSLWGVGEVRPADQFSSDGAIFRQGPN
jgi:hypothetical protein